MIYNISGFARAAVALGTDETPETLVAYTLWCALTGRVGPDAAHHLIEVYEAPEDVVAYDKPF